MAKSLNEILAATLRMHMEAKGLSARQLGLKSGLAPNTITNYLKGADPARSKSGKVRSAKLAEIDMLAEALEVSAQALLIDPADLHAAVASATQAAMGLLIGADSAPRKQAKKAA